MQLANSSRTLLPLALSAVLATCVLAQEHPNVQPNAVRDQLTKQAPAESQPQSAPQSPAAPPAKPSSPAAAKGPAKGQAKAPAKAPAKAAAADKGATKAPSGNSPKPPAEKPAAEKAPVARRDPFDTLLTKARAGDAPPENLPPGKAGLIVETLRIDGIVRSPNAMIAIVSNSQQRVYFLREGDKLYDGSVEKIALDAISFHEIGKDAFGKPLDRVVTKRLYPSPGEQQ
jgi:Tfp pilus assembly protein PilP